MTPGASFKVAEIIKPVLKSISESFPASTLTPEINNKLQKCTKLLPTKYSFSHSHSCCHTTKVKCCKHSLISCLGLLVSIVAVKCKTVSEAAHTTRKKNLPKHSSFWHQAGLQQLKSIGVSLANSCRREQCSKCSKALERRQTADTDRRTHVYTHIAEAHLSSDGAGI